MQTVGVVGLGVMGRGIAQTCAEHGCRVLACDVRDDLVEQGLGALRRQLDRQVERGKRTAEDRDALVGRISGATDLADLAGCQIVIEAATEDLAAKQAVFRRLGAAARPDALLCSNTSTLPIAELAAVTARPDRVVGTHFFNPAPVLTLVEVVAPITASEAVVERAMAFVRRIGHEPIRVQDTPGFIVNRLLVPFLFDAIRMLEGGTAGAADVDQACRLGLAHAMGPLATADLIGLDTLLHVAEAMHRETADPALVPPPLLRRLVAAGRLGRKTGQGFYTYE